MPKVLELVDQALVDLGTMTATTTAATTGGTSTFIYGFNDAPLRRKGTMTPFQRRRRAEL